MEHDDILLKVGSKTPVENLASAISHGVYASKTVTLRAVGAGAISQAVKALAIARGMVAPQGFDLGCIPGFTSVTMPDAVVTGVILKIVVL